MSHASNIPFAALNYVHANLRYLVSTHDDKFDITDANRVPYAIRFNREIENVCCVADENGCVRVMRTRPRLESVQEFAAHKSCIYDIQWLSRHVVACGGGDKHVAVYDVSRCARIASLKAHTESVKSVAHLDHTPFIVASGSRDGSIFIFDTRCNRTEPPAPTSDNMATDATAAAASTNALATDSCAQIRPVNGLHRAHFLAEGGPSAHASSSSGGGGGGAFGNFGGSSASGGRGSAVLRSRLNSPSCSPSSSAAAAAAAASKMKPTPVSSILFQSEHVLVSAGATDGLVKVWDTRRLHLTSSAASRHAGGRHGPSSSLGAEPLPLHVFDNQVVAAAAAATHDACSHQLASGTSTAAASLKGYSSLTMNSTKTRLYSNCMNSSVYEYNLVTCNQRHTRILNVLNPKLKKASAGASSSASASSTPASGSDSGGSSAAEVRIKGPPPVAYHLNKSNFIKASLSPCDNFLLTGSSDCNAYIYSTSINNSVAHFKRHMPVLVLRGHTSEVTTVDWNPLDAGQLVTCSDDNTIRAWTVRRDTADDPGAASQVNFARAEIIDEYSAHKTATTMTRKADHTENTAQGFRQTNRSDGSDTEREEVDGRHIDDRSNDYDDSDESWNHYIPTIRFNKRIYNKHRPHVTGVYDDFLFVGYEHQKALRHEATTVSTSQDHTHRHTTASTTTVDERDLCSKCESIQIDTTSTVMRPGAAALCAAAKATEIGVASATLGSSNTAIDTDSSLSPTSRLLTSIENDLRGHTTPSSSSAVTTAAAAISAAEEANNALQQRRVANRFVVQHPLANMPINLIEESESSRADKLANSNGGGGGGKSEAAVVDPFRSLFQMQGASSFALFRRQTSSTTLLSSAVSSAAAAALPPHAPGGGSKAAASKRKTILRHKSNVTAATTAAAASSSDEHSPNGKSRLLHADSLLTRTPTSVSKKRPFNALLRVATTATTAGGGASAGADANDTVATYAAHDDEPRTPQSKRRLTMATAHHTAATAAADSAHGSKYNTPNSKHVVSCSSVAASPSGAGSGAAAAAASPIRTILHYFSPKTLGKH